MPTPTPAPVSTPKVITQLPANPYKGLPEDQTSRLNAEISTDDFLQLKSFSPRHGTIQTIINLYVRTIILELADAGVTHYSDENLGKLRSIVLRHTHLSLIGEVSKGDEPTGAASVREPHKDSESKPADSASKPSPRKGRVGKTT